jgi:hypothetical protein
MPAVHLKHGIGYYGRGLELVLKIVGIVAGCYAASATNAAPVVEDVSLVHPALP